MERKRGEWRSKKRGKCERSVPPGLWPTVCFCGYVPPYCLLAESEGGGADGGGGASESMTVNKQGKG